MAYARLTQKFPTHFSLDPGPASDGEQHEYARLVRDARTSANGGELWEGREDVDADVHRRGGQPLTSGGAPARRADMRPREGSHRIVLATIPRSGLNLVLLLL